MAHDTGIARCARHYYRSYLAARHVALLLHLLLLSPRGHAAPPIKIAVGFGKSIRFGGPSSIEFSSGESGYRQRGEGKEVRRQF